MRRDLPADDQVTVVMERVLAQAAENGRSATVSAVEKALGIPHATFDRNYRHLIDDFRQRAQKQAASTRKTGPVHTDTGPGQAMRRLRRENEDLRRLVKIYAESIRQLTLDHLELEAKLNAVASVATLPSRRTADQLWASHRTPPRPMSGTARETPGRGVAPRCLLARGCPWR